MLQGDELNDLHINACQVLLAKQFPSLAGLKSTLVKHHIGGWTKNIVQILMSKQETTGLQPAVEERISVPSLVNRQLHTELVRLGNIKPFLLAREATI